MPLRHNLTSVFELEQPRLESLYNREHQPLPNSQCSQQAYHLLKTKGQRTAMTDELWAGWTGEETEWELLLLVGEEGRRCQQQQRGNVRRAHGCNNE